MDVLRDILDGAENGHPFMNALVLVRRALDGSQAALLKLDRLVGTFHQLRRAYTSAVVNAAREDTDESVQNFADAVRCCDPAKFAKLRRAYGKQVRALFRNHA